MLSKRARGIPVTPVAASAPILALAPDRLPVTGLTAMLRLKSHGQHIATTMAEVNPDR